MCDPPCIEARLLEEVSTCTVQYYILLSWSTGILKMSVIFRADSTRENSQLHKMFVKNSMLFPFLQAIIPRSIILRVLFELFTSDTKSINLFD